MGLLRRLAKAAADGFSEGFAQDVAEVRFGASAETPGRPYGEADWVIRSATATDILNRSVSMATNRRCIMRIADASDGRWAALVLPLDVITLEAFADLSEDDDYVVYTAGYGKDRIVFAFIRNWLRLNRGPIRDWIRQREDWLDFAFPTQSELLEAYPEAEHLELKRLMKWVTPDTCIFLGWQTPDT